VALGVIQARGSKVVDPGLVSFGPDEADFLARHVRKARTVTSAMARSRFRHGSTMPALLDKLRTVQDDEFEESAKHLQIALAAAMSSSTNASDCVFAVVHTSDQADEAGYITLLKLDAVVEAARTSIETGKVTLQVLKELLPEPGDLQKGVAWPDSRSDSDAIVVDKNRSHAKYFQTAFEIEVSLKPVEAEAELTRKIVENIPSDRQADALNKATELNGPMNEILTTLASEGFPELSEPALAASEDNRPPGIIRPNKIAARPVVWRADGIELKVPPKLMGNVKIEPHPQQQGWQITVHTLTEPEMGV
jgi:hypothetical protein